MNKRARNERSAVPRIVLDTNVTISAKPGLPSGAWAELGGRRRACLAKLRQKRSRVLYFL